MKACHFQEYFNLLMASFLWGRNNWLLSFPSETNLLLFSTLTCTNGWEKMFAVWLKSVGCVFLIKLKEILKPSQFKTAAFYQFYWNLLGDDCSRQFHFLHPSVVFIIIRKQLSLIVSEVILFSLLGSYSCVQ